MGYCGLQTPEDWDRSGESSWGSHSMKLVLGTAEFGGAYGRDVKEPPKIEEIKDILNLARRVGIDTLDTATAYNCSHILREYAQDFKIITKFRYPYDLTKILEDLGRDSIEGLLYHSTINEPFMSVVPDKRVKRVGHSLYFPHQYMEHHSIVQFPLSISWPHFLPYMHLMDSKIYVRSIFAAGELLGYYSVKNCIDFVKGMDHKIDGYVVGVNTAKELEEILKYW